MIKKKKEAPEFKAWSRRKWLNTAAFGGTAFVEITVEEICKSYSHASMDATIKIGDCSRIVNLEFWVGDDEKVGNEHAMKKIDALIAACEQFKVKMQEAIDAANKSKAEGKLADAKEALEREIRNARGE